MIDRDRIEKLPRWVQTYIHRLEMDLKDAKDQLRQMDTNDTPIAWHTFDEKHGIPGDSWVEFDLPEGGKLETSIAESKLYIRTSSQGYPCVLPCTSNAFYVFVKERR